MSVPNAAGRIVRNKLWFEDRKYTRVPNDWARDRKIGYRALGILTFLLSHTENWSMTIRELAAATREPEENRREGEAACRNALQQLQQRGYLDRTRERTPEGKLGGAIWHLADPFYPDMSENPRSAPKREKPPLEKPPQDEPPLDEPPLDEPPLGFETTTEDHFPEDQDQKTNERNPYGYVSNVSPEAHSAIFQKRPAVCSRSPRGHDFDTAGGWCLNACGERQEQHA